MEPARIWLTVSLAWISGAGCAPKLDEEFFLHARRTMVEAIRAKGISDRGVLAAMEKVERHRFVHGKLQALAYEDHPLSIGYDQTLGAPSMIARMIEIANPGPADRVLELRTGCGYQTALLAELAREVFSVETVRPLAASARARLQGMGYGGVSLKEGDLFAGWAERGPYDLVVCAAAPDHLPASLVDQLAEGGRMILPIGDLRQELILVKKKGSEIVRESYGPVRFGPMLREQDLTPAQRGAR